MLAAVDLIVLFCCTETYAAEWSLIAAGFSLCRQEAQIADISHSVLSETKKYYFQLPALIYNVMAISSYLNIQ